MEILKQLTTLVEQATNDANNQPPIQLYQKILAIINSRVDMPKNTLTAVSKRLSIKNKKVLFYCFDLLEYLSYRCELSLYSQISTKEFLLKISGLLMSQDIDPAVHTKILQTVKCWEELFRPHEDLIPLFFQFYAGLLRKEFKIQNNYSSPHKPSDFKVYKQIAPKKSISEDNRDKAVKEKPKVEATKSEQKTFEQIRQKLILTNQIIDNVNPAEGVKGNTLLLQMMDQIKVCQKKINQTINQNPNQKIMELALAANDQIYITYRRFKDLQKNRKPEPFILSELASDLVKEKNNQKNKNVQSIKEPQPKKDIFDDFNQKPSKKEKIEQKKAEIDIFDLAYQPKKSQVSASSNLMDIDMPIVSHPPSALQSSNVNIFDILDSSVNPQPQPQSLNLGFFYSPNTFQKNNYIQNNANNNIFQPNLNNQNSINTSYQSNAYSNITLSNNFQTENDFAKYDDRTLEQKITDISDIFKK